MIRRKHRKEKEMGKWAIRRKAKKEKVIWLKINYIIIIFFFLKKFLKGKFKQMQKGTNIRLHMYFPASVIILLHYVVVRYQDFFIDFPNFISIIF